LFGHQEIGCDCFHNDLAITFYQYQRCVNCHQWPFADLSPTKVANLGTKQQDASVYARDFIT